MKSEKLSISLPHDTASFVEKYRKRHRLRTRSEVIAKAVDSLRERELEEEYRSAAEEDRKYGYTKEWDVTLADGLAEDEAW